jgi:predicted nucleic acid-binding protein
MWWRPCVVHAKVIDLRLVIDASACLEVCLAATGFDLLAGHELLAPPLIRSEVLSALRTLDWRRSVSAELVRQALARIPTMPIAQETGPDHLERTWSVAARLGWAKTYDAEYVALALTTESPLVTLDGRLRRGASGLVAMPLLTELEPAT